MHIETRAIPILYSTAATYTNVIPPFLSVLRANPSSLCAKNLGNLHTECCRSAITLLFLQNFFCVHFCVQLDVRNIRRLAIATELLLQMCTQYKFSSYTSRQYESLIKLHSLFLDKNCKNIA